MGIVLHDVTFRYAGAGGAALRHASCSLQRGELTLLTGENGGGKSTILKLLLGCAPPSEGRVSVDGVAAHTLAGALRAHVAYLPQRPYLPDRASVRQAFALLGAVDDPIVRQWLDRLGILQSLMRRDPSDPLAVPLGRLSAGQKQRLALARIGALDRAIWLLDEPDAALDAEGLERLAEVLRDEASRRIVVVAAHSPSLRSVAKCIYRVEAGHVTEEQRATAP